MNETMNIMNTNISTFILFLVIATTLTSGCSNKVKSIETYNSKDLQTSDITKDSIIKNDTNDIIYNVHYQDTVTVNSTAELLNSIKSNRLINLNSGDYILREPPSFYIDNNDTIYTYEKQGILIDSVRNLKLLGGKNVSLLAYDRNATVLKFKNSYNIHLENCLLYTSPSPRDS